MDGQPLIQTTTSSAITTRLLFVLFVAALSIWAHFEASKGFQISVLNDAGDSPSGRRFDLLFYSNDKATRIILDASRFVERLLYPDDRHPRKPVHRVTLRLAHRSSTHPTVEINSPHDFTIHVSSAIMNEPDVDAAMASAVRRGMARVWLWGVGEGSSAPETLVDGMVELIAAPEGMGHSPDSGRWVPPESGGGRGCWEDEEPIAVARFLWYCEGHRRGFLARLNRELRDGWHVRKVDEALGMPARLLCDSYQSTAIRLRNISDSSTSVSWAGNLGTQAKVWLR